MYSPLNTQSGAAYAAGVTGAYKTAPTPDGLSVDTSSATVSGTAVIPDRLFSWLLDVRLLRNVPLTYLVADSALLPPESIRFFNVDLTWVDRIIDGVFSAANTGTVDITYSAALLQLVREALDTGLSDLAATSAPNTTWTPAQGMTGMLIRSDLVRRWPDLIVRAYGGTDEKTAPPAPVLRAEMLSNDVYIALFGGTPQMVQIREPHVGVRFGLDILNNVYSYEQRDLGTGLVKSGAGATTVTLLPHRCMPVRTIATANAPGDPRTVAIELMRPPYVQQFFNAPTVPETRGYGPPPPTGRRPNGHIFNVQALVDRAAELQKMRKA